MTEVMSDKCRGKKGFELGYLEIFRRMDIITG